MRPHEAIRRWVFGELESGHREGVIWDGTDSCEVVRREVMYRSHPEMESGRREPTSIRFEARNEAGVMQTFVVFLDIVPLAQELGEPREPDMLLGEFPRIPGEHDR